MFQLEVYNFQVQLEECLCHNKNENQAIFSKMEKIVFGTLKKLISSYTQKTHQNDNLIFWCAKDRDPVLL